MYKYIAKDKHMTGVEIGVWEGANMVRLLTHYPNLYMIGIDPFEAYKDWNGFVNKDTIAHSEQLAIKNLKSFIGRYELIKKYSNDALGDLSDNSFDFVYIDADHSYDWALHDMRGYWNKVKSGGLLCGHDRSLDGVKRALATFCKEINFNITKTNYPQSDSWYIVKP